MNTQKYPFRELIKPLPWERQLEQVDIPAQLNGGGQTTIGIYVETCGRNAVRLIVTEGYELIWTQRIEAKNHDVGTAAAMREANDMISDPRIQKEYGFVVTLVTATPSIAFPANESELARI